MHSELFEPHLSFEDRDVACKTVVVGDENAIPHDGNLVELQDDALHVHASIPEEEIGNEDDKSAASNLSFESSYEDQNSSTFDEDVCNVEGTHDDVHQSVNDGDSTFYHSVDFKSENLYRNDMSQGSHHLPGQLKVSEGMIATAIEHFDVAQQWLEDSKNT